MGMIIFLGFFIYGGYWIAKTVSYKLFYKNMVQNSIIEMVKSESLKEVL